MPISIIQKKIQNSLSNINYAVPNVEFNPAKNLKRSILDDSNILVNIISEKTFNVYIEFENFHEILANNFHFNYQRFKIQSKELRKLKDSPSVAWFLITMYYSAFFASNEISNLAGYYSFNFSKEEKKSLLHKNISTDTSAASEFIQSDIQNFFGQLSLCDEPNRIKIACESGGGKPHELSWKILSRLLGAVDRGDEFARVLRLKNILENNLNWKRPNQIRNEWNYSKSELYSLHNEQYKHDQMKYFNSFSMLKKWAENRKSRPTSENDDFISIMFLFNTLEKIMDNLNHILPEEETGENLASGNKFTVGKNRKRKRKK